MKYSIRKMLRESAQQFDLIPEERKARLELLGKYMTQRYQEGLPVSLVYICTHNSRRSHFGQIAGALAAAYYQIDNVQVFSGGTEVTAFHPNAIDAIRQLGFEITAEDEASDNPHWNVAFGTGQFTQCYSKLYDDPANPRNEFVAIMVCSQADQACPFVSGMDLKLLHPYEDPKYSDGTPEQREAYTATFLQITREMLYAFSTIK